MLAFALPLVGRKDYHASRYPREYRFGTLLLFGASQSPHVRPRKKSTRTRLTCVRMPCICLGMDGANNTPNVTARLIALDITDAAYRLWAERYDELICSGEEYGHGPSVDVAWEKYIERGAFNYPWFDCEGDLNHAGCDAFDAFAAAFEDGPGIYGMRNAR